MKITGIALLSGGLDSLLAVKVIQQQGIAVQGVTFETPFFNAQKAQAAARNMGLPLRVIDITPEHLQMLRSPRYGYGRNMNPCIDCHALMLKVAGRFMEETGADFILTGEVLGQRPMSQGKQSLYVVAKHSGYPDYIIRPLSARLLPETKQEREGKVDRQKLLAIQGRGRKTQMAMAQQFGITTYETPAGGCLLTDPMYSKRLKDLWGHDKDCSVRDIELLKHGRHFWVHGKAKVIIGRNRLDNEAIEKWFSDGDTLIYMADYPGPTALIPRGADEQDTMAAASLCALYSDAPKDRIVTVTVKLGQEMKTLQIQAADKHTAESWIV